MLSLRASPSETDANRRLWERLAVARKPIEVDIDVGAKAIHGDQPQVASKVPRVLTKWGRSVRLRVRHAPAACVKRTRDGAYETRQWKTVSEASHGRLEVGGVKVLVDVLAFHGGVHVGPDEGNSGAGDAAAFVGDLDGDVLLTLDDDDLDGGEGVLVLVTEALDDGAKGVLEELEADVGQVAGDVVEVEVLGADELDGRTLEHGVVLFADESGERGRGHEVSRVSGVGGQRATNRAFSMASWTMSWTFWGDRR